jgi:hypothetical protein
MPLAGPRFTKLYLPHNCGQRRPRRLDIVFFPNRYED